MPELSIEERVANGVRALDADDPWWVERIALERLDMASCTQCVLGQLFGLYQDAPDDLRCHVAADNGFDLYPSDEPYEWTPLEDEWRRVIAERRSSTVDGGT